MTVKELLDLEHIKLDDSVEMYDFSRDILTTITPNLIITELRFFTSIPIAKNETNKNVRD